METEPPSCPLIYVLESRTSAEDTTQSKFTKRHELPHEMHRQRSGGTSELPHLRRSHRPIFSR